MVIRLWVRCSPCSRMHGMQPDTTLFDGACCVWGWAVLQRQGPRFMPSRLFFGIFTCSVQKAVWWMRYEAQLANLVMHRHALTYTSCTTQGPSFCISVTWVGVCVCVCVCQWAGVMKGHMPSPGIRSPEQYSTHCPLYCLPANGR